MGQGSRKPITPSKRLEQHAIDVMWWMVEVQTRRFALSLFATLAKGEGPGDASSAKVPAVQHTDAPD